MPETPRSTEQEFTSDWNKAVAFSQSNGISAASYLPVYQLDLNRIQNGEFPMSQVERNLEILAAHNPNDVTSAPSDNPNPSNVMGNTISDAGKVATGIAGIFTGSFEHQLWNSTKATFEGIINPASLAAKTPGGTIGNWLTHTLAAYLPGAADIGQVLQADPTLSGDAGFKALAEHPLISALDVLPGAEGALEKAGARGVLGAGGRDMAASLAARSGGKGILSNVAEQIGSIPTGKAGTTLEGNLVANLSVSDVIKNMAGKIGPGGAGVGPALSSLGEAYNTAGALATNSYAWLMDGPTRALADLDPDQALQVKKILDTRNQDQGAMIRKVMDDPAADPRVKEAITLSLNGPLRFATEASIFEGGLRPIETLDGRTGMYSATARSTAAVLGAKTARDAAHKAALDELGRLAPHAEAVSILDKMLVGGTKQFVDRLTTARKALAADNMGIPDENTTQDLANPTRFHKTRGISKLKQVEAVVGEGGLADQVLDQIKRNHDPHQILHLSKAMSSRLSKWGPKSVDAADAPELAALADTVDKMATWAQRYIDESNEIDRAIHGEITTQRELRNQRGEYGSMMMDKLKDRQTRERENLTETFDAKMSRARGSFVARTRLMTDHMTEMTGMIEDSAEQEAQRATNAHLDNVIMPKVRGEIARIKHNVTGSIYSARRDFLNAQRVAKLEHQRDLLKLTKKHYAETAALKKAVAEEKVGMGEALRRVITLGKAVDKFHTAVADHPSDEYRDVFTALYEKHLMAHEHSAEMVEATVRRQAEIGMGDARIAKIRSDPHLIAEYMTQRFDGIFMQPNIAPEVAEDAQRAVAESLKSAKDELKLLIARGMRIQYIPTATYLDERLGRDSMSPMIGKGIPKPDMAKGKVWDMTPQNGDFAVGINKAVVQALRRDATIDLAEHYLKPMTMTRDDVGNFIDAVYRPEEKEAGGNLGHQYLKLTAKDLGLTVFKPEAMFGFRLPRWGNDEVYLPTPVVNALKQLDVGPRWKLLGTTNKIFRYSILGLSPRYTAHIVFGATMMLGLRSTPYAVTMIGEAARALRDGTLPLQLSRHNVEEGFDDSVLRLHNQEGGKDAAKMMVHEHIEQVQKVAKTAAKPLHYIRALADLNFRFTRYVRDLQSAVAYLDGAAKAERRSSRVAVEDPVTGKPVTVSTERAVTEGMHHVQEVFGNLGRMSPFERQVAQSIMPFYGWQKHILSYVMSYPFDHPMRSLVLSQLAFNASQQVPAGYPLRIQFLLNLGSPDAEGNVNAVDIRALDPFRDVANYASLTGFFEALNPTLLALPSVVDPQLVYGSTTLYPNVTYNDFYGISTAGPQGNVLTGLSQFIPQLGAAGDALQAAGGLRSTWNTDRSAAIKQILSSMNVPFVNPPINLKQIAARDEAARYETAKTDASNAFSTGDFSGLTGYKTVPNPLNPAFEITPAALAQLYARAQQATPGVAPIESLLPPPTPANW